MRQFFRYASSALFFAAALYPLTAQTSSAAAVGNPSTAAAKTPPALYESDPKFIAAMADAKRLMHQRQYGFAADAYKKANKIAGGSCTRCLKESYDLQVGLHSYKEAIALATQLQALALTPREKSGAEVDLGDAILKQAGDKPKAAQLEAAHAALQSALADYPGNNTARFSDACLLARMGKTTEAQRQFAACADAAAPTDPMRPRARRFAQDPALSLAKMAPAFSVTALDGTHFTLDEMGGRVVLIDFWATWCGPCKEELPHLQKIAKEFTGQPLVIISISWDSDDAKWRDFVATHGMTWVQYRDADHSLSNNFGVPSIPHYFTIDSDGVLTGAMLGSGDDVEGKLKKLLKKAREEKPAELAIRSSGTN